MKATDKRFLLNIFSSVLISFGITAVPCVLAAALENEITALIPLSVVSVVCVVPGLLIRRFCDLRMPNVRPRMNYFAVIISWLFTIAAASVVYFSGITGATWYDSVFEATASLTTTGTGMLGMQNLPLSLQLWRSELNWFGGIGMILISVSLLTRPNFNCRALVSVEIPGSDFLRSPYSFRRTCKRVILIYAVLTAVQFLLLCIAGMPAFTSLLTSLSNISTAGLQHINNGTIIDLPVAQKIIITVFSFIGSLNVSVLILVFFRKAQGFFKDTETIMYTVRILITTVIISSAISVTSGINAASAAGDTLMQTVSFLSTSGYRAADCTGWPVYCQILIILQMFIGACAASTGGGIKAARTGIGFRTISFGLFRHVHSNAVRPVRYNRETVKSDLLVQTNLYISLFMVVYITGVLLLSIDNKNESIYDALNYSQAMLTNTGTTLIPASPDLHFSAFSKIVMSVEMLCGRLEIYPVLMLLFRSFWKSDSNR